MRRMAILLAMIVMAAPVGAQAVITGSKHDLTILTDAVTKKYDGQICVYCHTPHNATTTSVALWNKSLAGLPAFTMYYAAGTGPAGNTRDAAPGQASLACLSCHEGTIAIDAIVNEPVTPTGTGGGIMNTINGGAAALGTSLTNDHPIAVQLPTGTEWQATPTNNVPLFGTNRVECASCHNPHKPGTDLKFLRVANTNSNLCKSCHIK